MGTINLVTGAITEIGVMTSMDKSTGGLHYYDGTMYAVGATNSDSSFLFTINLATGAAKEFAPIILSNEPVHSATALAYADGKMYLFINREM